MDCDEIVCVFLYASSVFTETFPQSGSSLSDVL